MNRVCVKFMTCQLKSAASPRGPRRDMLIIPTRLVSCVMCQEPLSEPKGERASFGQSTFGSIAMFWLLSINPKLEGYHNSKLLQDTRHQYCEAFSCEFSCIVHCIYNFASDFSCSNMETAITCLILLKCKFNGWVAFSY